MFPGVSVPRLGAGPALGCKGVDGWQSWSITLGHQQGEEGTKQTLLEILLCARQFWGFFSLQLNTWQVGAGGFISSGNVSSLFAWGLPTFGPSCSAPAGCCGHSVPSSQHWTLTRLSPCPWFPRPQGLLQGCACHCSSGGTKPSQNELLG